MDFSEKYKGFTPLEASIRTHTEIVKALLTAGASVSQNPGKLLELLRRIWSNRENKKCCEILLEFLKADIYVNAKLDEEKTILIIAIRKSNLSIIKALIEASPDLNIVPENIIDDRDNFALFEAACIGDQKSLNI
ncbi:ankyrin repeat domain-containing protein [Okeania sp.]|uniref:ankyrin repeat domain-containing protein n=1 Tax=Okeania sp. TaxID=3100323 RepID=UPI0035C8B064